MANKILIYASGKQEYLIKPDTINIVLFEGGTKFRLAKDMRYGKSQLQMHTSKADYQHPYKPVITAVRSIPVKYIQVKTATMSKPGKSRKMNKANLAHFKKLQTRDKCKLKNNNWAYTGTKCKNGFAHGKGSAEDNNGLKFIGEFITGQRVKGEIHQNNNMIFSGNLVNDKPNGNAIFFYEDEYEECRFFKGKRIDMLYNIQKENTKMQQRMTQIQQINVSPNSNSDQSDISDYAIEAIQREGSDKAVNFIFDSLF